MADPTVFEVVIQKMIELGFYNYLFPFLITSVIMYALFRKSRVISDSAAINGVVALSIGLLVFGFPVLVGVTFGTELSTFFTQATVWILILVMAGIIAAVFYPDLFKMLEEQMTKSKTFLFVMLAVAIAIFVTSGLFNVFTQPGNPLVTGKESQQPGPPTDVVIMIAALIIFMVMIIIAALILSKGRSG